MVKFSNEGPRPFQKGDNFEIAKILLMKFKNLSSSINSPISTILGTKHHWVNGIQVCSNEGPRPFPRGGNYEIT